MKINGSPLSESTFPRSLQMHGSSCLRGAMLTEKPAARYLRGSEPQTEFLDQNPEGFHFRLWRNPSSFPVEHLWSKPCSGRGGCQSPDVVRCRDQPAEAEEQGGGCARHPFPSHGCLLGHWSLQNCGERMGQVHSWDQALSCPPWGLLLHLRTSIKTNWGIPQTAWLCGFIQVGLLLMTLSHRLWKVCAWGAAAAATPSVLPRFYCTFQFWAVISFNFQ